MDGPGFDPDMLQGMNAADIVVEASDTGIKKVKARIVVDGDDGDVLKQNGLGILEVSHSLLGVNFKVGLVDEVVIFLVGPAGSVVAASGHKQVQEGVGIQVIPDP